MPKPKTKQRVEKFDIKTRDLIFYEKGFNDGYAVAKRIYKPKSKKR